MQDTNIGYISSLDGSFIETNAFIDATTYSNTYENEYDMLNDSIIGIYTNIDDNTVVYKREKRVILPDGTIGYVTTAYKVTKIDNSYYGDTMGIISAMPTNNAFTDICHALGLEYKLELVEYYTRLLDNSYIHDDKVDAIITKNKIFTYSNDLINAIRNIIFDSTDGNTDIGCKYDYIQKELPVGASTITSWDNSNIPDLVCALDYNNNLTSIDNENLHNQLTMLSENDSVLKTILSKPLVRIGLRSNFPTDTHLFVWGYDLLNNDIVTTQNSGKNQTYGVTITSITGIEYYTSNDIEDYPTLHKVDDWHFENVAYSVNAYNYIESGYFSMANGFGIGGVAIFKAIFSNIGMGGNTKPYAPLPQYTTLPDKSKTLDENYPNWQPDDVIPVNRPVSVNYNTQNWQGIPDITITYTLRPIINRPIILPKEEPAPPTDIILPETTNSGLFQIYLPSDSEMATIGGNLYDPTFFEEIKLLFSNSPLDAVISYHDVYLSQPQIDSIKESGKKSVYFGNVDMGVESDYTNKRYIELDFGSLPIKLEFDDIRDYQRNISIYLPFIGYQNMDIDDFVGNGTTNIYLKYIVDILNGDCVANLYISKDGLNDKKFLYSFNGNISTSLPLTATDRSRLLTNVGGLVANTIGSLATGGLSVGGLVSSTIGTITNSKPSINRSGDIKGNFGAMNYKRPFIILESPRPLESDYSDISGYTTTLKTRLSSMTGYVHVKECHVDTIPNATREEKELIETILKTGIII